MSNLIRAVFEGGVFRPLGPVDLPEGGIVEFEPRPVEPIDRRNDAQKAIYAILSERFDGGDPEVSARHSEHQP